MVNDKDIDTVLGLLPTEAVYYFTQPATSRALPAEELLRRWQVIHASRLSGGGENACGVLGCSSPLASSPLASSPNCYPTVREALTAAQEAATADDIIFIGGSNYVVGEVLQQF